MVDFSSDFKQTEFIFVLNLSMVNYMFLHPFVTNCIKQATMYCKGFNIKKKAMQTITVVVS